MVERTDGGDYAADQWFVLAHPKDLAHRRLIGPFTSNWAAGGWASRNVNSFQVMWLEAPDDGGSES